MSNFAHPFEAGDRVICIDARSPRTANAAPLLREGEVYTVAEASFRPHGRGGPVLPGVSLIEAPFASSDEGWLASRFRLAEDGL